VEDQGLATEWLGQAGQKKPGRSPVKTEEVDERLDAPGRGICNTTRHEGHVQPEQVLGREDEYRVDRIAHWAEDQG
jgi:hypothetical protein